MASWLVLALSVHRESPVHPNPNPNPNPTPNPNPKPNLNLNPNPNLNPVHYRAARASFGLKLCCCAGSLAPLPTSFVYHPASPLARGRQPSHVDQGGLQQWLLVGCIG